jgi:hypothetical protein
VKISKILKLKRHVKDAQEEGCGENLTGLLVYNPYRMEDVSSRKLNTENFVDDLKDEGFKFITTSQVYQMISLYKRGEIDTPDVIQKLKSNEEIIEFAPISKETSTIRDRISSIQSRIKNVLS